MIENNNHDMNHDPVQYEPKPGPMYRTDLNEGGGLPAHESAVDSTVIAVSCQVALGSLCGCCSAGCCVLKTSVVGQFFPQGKV